MFKSKAKRLFGGNKQSAENRHQNQPQNGQQQLELEPTTMIVAKQEYLDFKQCHRTYSCAHCRAHLADHDQLISKLFQGNHGRAYLFNKVLNVGCKQAVQRELLTGLHAVADIYCDNCETTLGWKYEQAFVPSQKYKEGKYIIEMVHMLKENNWDLTSYNAREFIQEARIEMANNNYNHNNISSSNNYNYNNSNYYYDLNSYYHNYKNHHHNHNSITSPTVMAEPITGAKEEVLHLATTRLSPGNNQNHSVIIDTKCTDGETRLVVEHQQQQQHETDDNPNQQLMTTTDKNSSDDETHTITTTTTTTSMKQNPPQEADESIQQNPNSNNNNINNNNSETGMTTSIIDITNIIEKRGAANVAEDPMEMIERSLVNLIAAGEGCAIPLANANANADATTANIVASTVSDNISNSSSSTSNNSLCSSPTKSQHESELSSESPIRIVIINGDEINDRISIYDSSSSSDSSLHDLEVS